MDQLPNEVVREILNLMPVKNQLAIKRVSRTFNELVLKTTTELDLTDIPRGRWLQVAKQMPKLKSVIGFHWIPSLLEITFVEKLASINKNIVNLTTSRHAIVSPYKIINCYMTSVKKLDPSHTASELRVVLRRSDYKKLLKKYPDLGLNDRIVRQASQRSTKLDHTRKPISRS